MAILFDGTDDFLNCGTTDDICLENAAMSVFVKLNLTGFTAGGQRILHREASGSTDGWSLAINADGTIEFEIRGGVAYLYVLSSTTISTGSDKTLIVTWDGSTTATNVHIYIDNVEVSYTNQDNGSSLSDTSGSTTYIGKITAGTAGRFFNGTMYGLAYFNRVINSTERGNLHSGMQSDAIKAMSGLSRWFPMDDGPDGTSADGDTVRDESSNAVNATGDDGANNTGLTWKGTSIRVSALTSTFSVPSVAPEVKQSPNAQTVTSSVTTSVPNVIFSDTGQIISSTLPPPSISTGGADATVNVQCLVIQSILTTPDAVKVDVGASAQQISSLIGDSVEGVTVSAPAQEIISVMPQPSLSGAADATVNAPCLVITSNICQPDEQVTFLANCQVIRSQESSALSGLISEWFLNDADASTTVIDNKGLFNGVATVNTSTMQAVGKLNGALTFSATQTVDIGDMTSYITTVASVELWFKPSAITGGNADQQNYGYTIFSNSPVIGSYGLLVTQKSGEIRVSAFTTSTTLQTTTGAGITVDTWHHLVVTVQRNGESKIWVNGQLIHIFTADNLVNWQSGSTIGDVRNGRLINFVGEIDCVRLFNRILSPNEVARLYNDGNGVEQVDSTIPVVSQSPNALTMASTLTDQALTVSADVSALQAIFSLPGVTISLPGSSVTFNASALTMSAILGSVSIQQIYRELAQARKHDQPRYVNKINALRRIAKRSDPIITTKHGL